MKKNMCVWVGLVLLTLFLAACAGNKQLKKEQAEATRKLGEAYLRQGNYTAALSELRKAEKLYPQDHILQNDLGIAYRKKGKTDLAIKHFKKAIKLKPDFAPAINNLGTAYFDIEGVLEIPLVRKMDNEIIGCSSDKNSFPSKRWADYMKNKFDNAADKDVLVFGMHTWVQMKFDPKYEALTSFLNFLESNRNEVWFGSLDELKLTKKHD